MKQKDSLRLALLGFCLLLVLSVLVGTFYYRSVVDQIQERELLRLDNSLAVASTLVRREVETARNRMFFLSRQSAMSGLLRARANTGTDRDDLSTELEWRSRLTRTMRNMMGVSENYLQIRLIGAADGGREVIRVERRGSEIVTVAKEDLQQKGGEGYFAEIAAMPPGSAYLGDVELNREHGRIEQPIRPVIRTGAPIHDETGAFLGFVIVNVDAAQLLQILRDAVDPDANLYVINQTGDFVYHPDESKTFGFEFGRRFVASDVFRLPGGGFLQGAAESYSGIVETTTGEDTLLYAHTFELDLQNKHHIYTAALAVPQVLLTAEARRIRDITGLGSVGFAALGAFLLYLVGARLGRPLAELTRAADEILGGKLVEEVMWPDHAPEEIGRLRDAFLRVITALQLSQKYLIEDNRRLDTIMNGVVDAVLLVSPDGRIERCNSSAVRMFGWEDAALVGQYVSVLMPPDLRLRHLTTFQASLEAGGSEELARKRRLVAMRRNGETFPIELYMSEQTIGGARKFIGIVRDLSDHERIAKLKSEFVSTVSHELRTPLTAIKGSVGLLLDGAMGEMTPPVRELLEIAATNCSRLIRLINDILDIDRIETGKMSFSFVQLDLNAVAREAAQGCARFSATKTIDLREAPLPALVRGDHDRLVQVVTNLLSNALKFSPDNASVGLIIRHRGVRWRLEVSDSGPGVPPEVRGRIFERFVHSDGKVRRKHSGSGLGLSISHAIIEAHEGLIDLETGPQGSTFYFELDAIPTE